VRRAEHSCCHLHLLNRPLIYGADNILAAAGFASEYDAMLTIVLEESNRHDNRAEDQPAHQRAAPRCKVC
jgi:hypothetical protein